MQFFQPHPRLLRPPVYLISNFFPTPPPFIATPFYSGLESNYNVGVLLLKTINSHLKISDKRKEWPKCQTQLKLVFFDDSEMQSKCFLGNTII